MYILFHVISFSFKVSQICDNSNSLSFSVYSNTSHVSICTNNNSFNKSKADHDSTSHVFNSKESDREFWIFHHLPKSLDHSLHFSMVHDRIFSSSWDNVDISSFSISFVSYLATYSTSHLTSSIFLSHHVNIYSYSSVDSFVGSSPSYVGTVPYSTSSVFNTVSSSFFHVTVYFLSV